MADTRIMHMVTDVVYDEDGSTVLYGTGELHDAGSLPPGVGYREVIAGDVHVATAPEHAPGMPEPKAKAEPEKPAGKTPAKAGN